MNPCSIYLRIKHIHRIDSPASNQEKVVEFDKREPFNIPLILDETSIFRVEIVRFPEVEDEFNEMDHVECALVNALKVCQESIVWSIFYSELEDMEKEIKEQISMDKPKELSPPPFKWKPCRGRKLPLCPRLSAYIQRPEGS